ncbi:MAG: EAL domain-containing protein [Dehalococcoidia bacterium]|nr:EAL domain-containing protein [Dehalococcoidia bacterium]
MVESDAVADADHLRRILDYYRERGYRVALDDLGAGFSSLALLEQVRPDFVKLDMHLIRRVDTNPYKAEIASGVLDLARSLGVPTIVEGIEDEGELNWVRAHGASYAQGYYLARPSELPLQGSIAA